MNTKITLSRLITLLADKTGKDSKLCEDVLKSFFKQISAALEDGESVKVKGLGTFKVSVVEARKSVDVTSGTENEIPAHSKVTFVPSKELAAAVNEPFEMFETIEIDENILEEELLEAEVSGDTFSTPEYEQELILEEEKMDELKKSHPDIEQIIASSNINDGAASNDTDPGCEMEEDNQETAEDETDNSEEDELNSGSVDAPDLHYVESTEDVEDMEETEESKSSAGKEEATESVTPAYREVGDKSKIEEIEESNDKISQKEADEENDEEDTTAVIPTPTQHVVVKHKGGFTHGFIWGMVGALLIFCLGLAALWFVNDDFANWGRGVFARAANTPDDSLPKDTVQIVSNSGLAQNNADNEEAEIAMQENEMSEMEGGVPEMVEDVAPENVVPTKPSDNKVVYDTITTTHYLTSMAKKHYGNFHLWPYIYKENEKILGHPNRIRPGTKVVIPDLKKYGVDPKNPKDIEKAKRMGTEIYDRFK